MEQQLKKTDLTHGEKLVGINFNVGNASVVHECKTRFAQAIDQIAEARESAREHGTLNAIKEQLLDEAETRIVDAQMWAVKAITYGIRLWDFH